MRVNGYQLIIDIILFILFLYVLFRKPAKPEKPLSDQEIEELIETWEPEPLIPPRTPMMELDEKVPVITSTTTTHVTIEGRQVLNMARNNFLGMIGNAKIEEAASKALYKYGTGTCGPRGFYGTIDIHLELEERIKKFMNSEDCVIYAYGFATVSSVIPAFAGRGDLLIADKGVSYAVQTGIKLSRSDVIWFEHNNMNDLERVLKEVKEKDRKTKRPLTRRYIVIEGVYYNYGDICPLSKIIELRDKYCYRLIMDDSYGIGQIGKTGRGTCEYYNIPAQKIEFLTGNLAAITSSVGGFCCASSPIIKHQRLSSTGYVYSASLPPLLAAASIAALDTIDQAPSLLSQLRKNVETIYQGLSSIDGLTATSSPQISAVIHMRLSKPSGDRYKDEALLQQIVDEVLKDNVLLTRAKYVHAKEAFIPPPSIRVTISAANTTQQLNQTVEAIRRAASKILKDTAITSDKGQINGNVSRRNSVKK
jgi:serine palmitoyltransferase